MVGNGSPNRAPGRPSPAVYRRRRIVAGVLALLVVIGLVAGIVSIANALGGEDAAASDTVNEATIPGPDNKVPGSETGTGTENATDKANGTDKAPASAPASPAAETKKPPAAGSEDPALCPAGSVGVSATTDALSYSAGISPVLTLTVTNNGTEPCAVNVGTSQMDFVVTSGSDRIFSSADCQSSAADLLKTIKPNSVETAKFTWDRHRSAPGCAEVPSKPNPGTYLFTARLGDLSSEGTTFELE